MAYKIYTKKLSAYERELQQARRKRKKAKRKRKKAKRIGKAVAALLFHLQSRLESAAAIEPAFNDLIGGDIGETFGLFSNHLAELTAQDAAKGTHQVASFLSTIDFWQTTGPNLAKVLAYVAQENAV